MSEHRWTIEEYDALHASVGIGPEWLASDRRPETIAEIAAGAGPGGLPSSSPSSPDPHTPKRGTL